MLLPTLTGGGAERVTLHVVQGLLAAGHELDLLVASPDGELRSQVPNGVRLVPLGGRRPARVLVNLVRHLRGTQPVVLLSALTHANLLAVAASRLSPGRRPALGVVEHLALSGLREGRRDLAYRATPALVRAAYRWADAVAAVSDAVADDLSATAGLARDRIRVLPNPVIPADFTERAGRRPPHPWFDEGAAPVVLAIGRLHPQKDFHTLIRAFAELRRSTEARLVILGEGPERAALEATARAERVEQHVALPGFVDDPAPYLGAAGALALTSRYEGAPMVIVEALAAGTPVVATDCPVGPRQLLADGRFGTLVSVGEVAAIAASLRAALLRRPDPVPESAWSPYRVETAVARYESLVRELAAR